MEAGRSGMNTKDNNTANTHTCTGATTTAMDVESPHHHPPPPRSVRRFRLTIAFTVVTVLLLVAGGLVGYFVYAEKHPPNGVLEDDTGGVSPDPKVSAAPSTPAAAPPSTPAPSGTGCTTLANIKADSERFIGFGTRVAGSNTTGWLRAHRMITERLACHGDAWTVSHDNFTQDTVIGKKRFFSNIVARLTLGNPAHGHLVLSAHFDSKLYHDITFLGACDSAVPCMMLLDLAEVIAGKVRGMTDTTSLPAITLVFFDGEEAFVSWTNTDSIYGARHLASRWASDGTLKTITLFVLYDLVGPSDSVPFPNYFSATTSNFRHFRDAEIGLTREGKKRVSSKVFFSSDAVMNGGVEDDHIPFLQRGVPVLHLIRAPFPSVWHTARDTLDAVHWDTVMDVRDITVRYLDEHWLKQ